MQSSPSPPPGTLDSQVHCTPHPKIINACFPLRFLICRRLCLSPSPCTINVFFFFEWHHTPSELFPNLLKLNIAPPGLGTIRCYVF